MNIFKQENAFSFRHISIRKKLARKNIKKDSGRILNPLVLLVFTQQIFDVIVKNQNYKKTWKEEIRVIVLKSFGKQLT